MGYVDECAQCARGGFMSETKCETDGCHNVTAQQFCTECVEELLDAMDGMPTGDYVVTR